MHFSHLKPFVPSASTNHVPSCSHVLDFAQVQPSMAQLKCRISLVKNVPTLNPVSSKGPHTCKGLHLSINLEEASHVSGSREQGLGAKQSEMETAIEDTVLDSQSNSKYIVGVVDRKDGHMKRNIGLVRKKDIPWNKGRKHSAETRERISYKTKEALRDPKVRMKMSEHRRPLSKRTKARIGASQARLWDKRLKWKRSREKFLKLWYDSIAKAAKRGGLDQDKLDWDSYEKLKREIVLKQLQLAADRAEAKLMKQLLAKERAEEKARAKAEKMTQKRKDDEAKGKLSGKSTRKQRSKEEIEELAVAQGLKLKERLTKIHKKKSRDGHVTGQDKKAWDSLDLESLEKKGTEASLADQIQAIRSKRAVSVCSDETPMASYSVQLSKLAQVQLVEKETKII